MSKSRGKGKPIWVYETERAWLHTMSGKLAVKYPNRNAKSGISFREIIRRIIEYIQTNKLEKMILAMPFEEEE